MGSATTGQDLTYAMWIKVAALPGGPKVIIWDDDPQGGGDSWLELLADGTVQTQEGATGSASSKRNPCQSRRMDAHHICHQRR